MHNNNLNKLDIYLSNHPELNRYIIQPYNNSKWARLICHWNEKDKSSIDQTSSKNIHLFLPLLNMENGDLHLDCSPIKLYAKSAVHFILRPFDITKKTIYHLAIPFSIPHIIFKTIHDNPNGSKKQIAKKCMIRSVQSIADIIRTPLYGTAMMIVNLAALTIGPFAPISLYDFRELTGKLVQSLHRTNEFVKGNIFPCFQSRDNLTKMDFYNEKTYEDIVYNPDATIEEKGLNNYVRAKIKFRREHYAFFNNPLGVMHPNQKYTSSCHNKIGKPKPNLS